MIDWDGAHEIEPEIGEEILLAGETFLCKKGGGLSPVELCNRCALAKRRSLCACFTCVGALRRDEMKVYLAKIERGEQVG